MSVEIQRKLYILFFYFYFYIAWKKNVLRMRNRWQYAAYGRSVSFDKKISCRPGNITKYRISIKSLQRYGVQSADRWFLWRRVATRVVRPIGRRVDGGRPAAVGGQSSTVPLVVDRSQDQCDVTAMIIIGLRASGHVRLRAIAL